MASFNKVLIAGNLTREPELRFLPNNTPVCDFGLAVNDRFKNASTGQYEDRPNFVDCTAFGTTAELINTHFKKGKPIFIEGKLRFEQWESQGQKRSRIKVVVDSWLFMDSKQDDTGTNAPRSSRTRPSDGYSNMREEFASGVDIQHDDIPF